jgi:hypothetical protein
MVPASMRLPALSDHARIILEVSGIAGADLCFADRDGRIGNKLS